MLTLQILSILVEFLIPAWFLILFFITVAMPLFLMLIELILNNDDFVVNFASIGLIIVFLMMVLLIILYIITICNN